MALIEGKEALVYDAMRSAAVARRGNYGNACAIHPWTAARAWMIHEGARIIQARYATPPAL